MELKDVIIKFSPEKGDSKILNLEEKKELVENHINTMRTVEAMKAGIPLKVEGKGSYQIENYKKFFEKK